MEEKGDSRYTHGTIHTENQRLPVDRLSVRNRQYYEQPTDVWIQVDQADTSEFQMMLYCYISTTIQFLIVNPSFNFIIFHQNTSH